MARVWVWFKAGVRTKAGDYVSGRGRTGRAGRSGRAFTLGTGEDRRYIDAIERLISKAIPRITIEGVAAASAEPTADEAEQGRPSRGQRGRRGGQGGAPRGRSRGDDR